ncbi:MAG: sialate O-acetylesterase [Treponemataceae bacterium]|nr:sialate O-acetylesterase [Treponemataceae bacterium]
MNGEFSVFGYFQSGMVLQQNKTAAIWGTAPAGSSVKVFFRGFEYSGAATEENQWRIMINAGEACTNQVLEVSCNSRKITFENVNVGEVWLCSGQSNMQLTMDRLRYSYPKEFLLPKNENIRLFTVPVVPKTEPDSGFTGGRWQTACAEELASFSGISYFFEKKLTSQLGVPVGIINASQGGSQIWSWLCADDLADDSSAVERMALCRQSGFVQNLVDTANKSAMDWRAECFEKQACSDSSDLDWQPVTFPGFCELVQKDGKVCGGVVWCKKTVELTQAQVDQLEEGTVRLWLSRITDSDIVQVNGIEVGRTEYQYPPRRYVVPKGVLRAGTNTILVRILQDGPSGFAEVSESKPMALFSSPIDRDWREIFAGLFNNGSVPASDDAFELNGGLCIDLRGQWLCAAGLKTRLCPPGYFAYLEPASLYNGMLNPMKGVGVRGFVWYQGEADADIGTDYTKMLTRLMAAYRRDFADSSAPFVVAGLPNWRFRENPLEPALVSTWADLRQVQKTVSVRDKNGAFANLTELGEWNDLHPENKKTAAERLADEALRIAFGKTVPRCPRLKKAKVSGDKILVTFETFGGALKANPALKNDGACADKLSGFSALAVTSDGGRKAVALCAELTGSDTVELSLPSGIDAASLLSVRYMYADSPCAPSILGENNLPAEPFVVSEFSL